MSTKRRAFDDGGHICMIGLTRHPELTDQVTCESKGGTWTTIKPKYTIPASDVGIAASSSGGKGKTTSKGKTAGKRKTASKGMKSRRK
jgi:hypothetical protein